MHDEMSSSYLSYAMSVIVSRALPDVRDGLKPVHRRVLYGAAGIGAQWNRKHKKSARIVGEVIGKYHPHGDQSIYDSLSMDLYYLGKVLKKKYQLLRWTYTVFMFGIILSVIAFAIALKYYGMDQELIEAVTPDTP